MTENELVPDQYLREDLKMEFSIEGPLTKEKLAAIREIFILPRSGLYKNLEGLQYCTSLRYLFLAGGFRLESIAPIAEIPSLEEVLLFDLPAVDASPLGQLPALKTLHVEFSSIGPRGEPLPQPPFDLSLLTDCHQLTDLWIAGTVVIHPESLKHLAHLATISYKFAADVAIADRLGSLPFATQIDVNVPPDADLTAIGVSARLETLALRGTGEGAGVVDLTPLRALPNFKYLIAEGINIADLSSLRGHPTLEKLLIQGAPLASIEGLADLPQLQWLTLRDTQVRSLMGAGGLPQCTDLSVSDTPLSDLSGIDQFPALLNLWLTNTAVQDLGPLTACGHLNELAIEGGAPPELEPIGRIPQLSTLTLTKLGLVDVSALANADQVLSLNLNENLITDIGPLLDCARLEDLQLEDNQVTDVAPLAAVRSALRVNLSSNPVSDLTPLLERPLGSGTLWLLLVDAPWGKSPDWRLRQALRERGIRITAHGCFDC